MNWSRRFDDPMPDGRIIRAIGEGLVNNEHFCNVT